MNSVEKAISGAQCRAARSLLNWSREDLAAASKVSRAAIADFETDKRQVRERTADDLQRTFRNYGIMFIFDTELEGGGAGVRYSIAEYTPEKWAEFLKLISKPQQKKPEEG